MTFLSVKEQLEIKRELKLEAERERIAAHSARKQADQEARALSARCAYCGAPGDRRSVTLENAKTWAGSDVEGRVSVARCMQCGKAERGFELQGLANVSQMTLYSAMERAGVEDLWEDHGGLELTGLSWAGWAYRARLDGAEDPGDPAKAFDHLAGLRPEMVDLTP